MISPIYMIFTLKYNQLLIKYVCALFIVIMHAPLENKILTCHMLSLEPVTSWKYVKCFFTATSLQCTVVLNKKTFPQHIMHKAREVQLNLKTATPLMCVVICLDKKHIPSNFIPRA